MKHMYSVLGYKENPLLEKYREKQYHTLTDILQANIDPDMFRAFEAKDIGDKKRFLSHPDQASILKSIDFIEEKDLSLSKLICEVEKFIAGEVDSMVMNSGLSIEGTDIRLSIEDNNPLNGYDAHPDSSDSGGKLGWGVQSPEQWKDVYDNTFALLRDIDAEFCQELNYMIQKIVPFGTAKHIHYSASYKECVGTLYMGYTLDTDIPELHVLEGLVHESTHNKLNLIMQYEDITLNDFREKYYSPYRPDARHMYGVFLGIHALIPTVYILLGGVRKGKITDMRWLEKIALYHIKNKIGIATMKKFGILSDMGKQVYQDLIEVSKYSDTLIKDMIVQYKLPISEIQKKAKEHFMQVNKDYPHLEY